MREAGPAASVISPTRNEEEAWSTGWVGMRWLLAEGGCLGQPRSHYSSFRNACTHFPGDPWALKARAHLAAKLFLILWYPEASGAGR